MKNNNVINLWKMTTPRLRRHVIFFYTHVCNKTKTMTQCQGRFGLQDSDKVKKNTPLRVVHYMSKPCLYSGIAGSKL